MELLKRGVPKTSVLLLIVSNKLDTPLNYTWYYVSGKRLFARASGERQAQLPERNNASAEPI